MSSTQTAVEAYQSPKQLSETLEKEHGLKMSADYIRAIRQECEARDNDIFVAGDARASDVIRFLKRNPHFRRRMARNRKD